MSIEPMPHAESSLVNHTRPWLQSVNANVRPPQRCDANWAGSKFGIQRQPAPELASTNAKFPMMAPSPPNQACVPSGANANQ